MKMDVGKRSEEVEAQGSLGPYLGDSLTEEHWQIGNALALDLQIAQDVGARRGRAKESPLDQLVARAFGDPREWSTGVEDHPDKYLMSHGQGDENPSFRTMQRSINN